MKQAIVKGITVGIGVILQISIMLFVRTILTLCLG